MKRYSGWLLISGLVAVTLAHWRGWRRDKARAAELPVRNDAGPVADIQPRVSILLPAWNEADNIGPCIESVLGLSYPDVELVVCAGGDDGTLSSARRHASCSVIVLEQYLGEGKQRALQRCFDRCTGDIIFLTDAGCILDDDSFGRVVAPVASGMEEVATGSWGPLDTQLSNPFVLYQWTHSVYLEVVGGEYVSSLIGRSAAVRRHALEEVQAFQTPVRIGTDLFLSNQLIAAGYRIHFVRDSRVRTRYSESVGPYLRQRSRWFRNPVLLGMGKETITIRGRLNNLRAGLAAVFMLGGPILGAMENRMLGGLWLVMAWHLVLNQARAVQVCGLRGVPRLRPAWKYLLFLPYMVLGWVATARGFFETLLPWRRWKW